MSQVFDIVEANGRANLIRAVNLRLAEGWVAQGGVLLIGNNWAQAIVAQEAVGIQYPKPIKDVSVGLN